MKCVEVYKELYHQEPFDVAFCPYRISPLGAHIDHQYGKINGLAIDKGIHMAYHPKQNGVVELQSLNFPKRAQFFVSAVPDEKQGDWADHLRGAAKMLGEKYRLKVGLSGIIEGSLPIGGLSSSASVIICFLSALCKVNGIHLEPMEMILTAKAAENQYVGVSCGKLDQSCEVLSKKNHLLYLDTKDDSYELIPTSEKMKPYKVAIFFSGLERSLKNSKYNLRQDECKAAAYALMGYAGINHQQSGRDLMTPDEVRLLHNSKCILFIRGERPVVDLKYNLLKHPNIHCTEDGGAAPYDYTAADNALDDLPGAPENYELLDMDDFLPAEAAEMKPTIQRIRRPK